MAETISVDLNCDLGESYGRYALGEDAAMMPLITSANVACGFHAGDATVMARTVALAKTHGVALGAHPGYPDLQGFGRRQMQIDPQEVAWIVLYQIGALAAFATQAGVALNHIKPHGALYNQAARDPDLAGAIAKAVLDFDPALILVGLAGSELVRMGNTAGLRTANEGFPDRMYLPDGQLMSRDQEGAVITEPEEVARNAVRLVREGITIDGALYKVDTLCLHGDNPEAVENARAVRRKLEAEGIIIQPLA
jgi:UPF0271 protein